MAWNGGWLSGSYALVRHRTSRDCSRKYLGSTVKGGGVDWHLNGVCSEGSPGPLSIHGIL